MLFRVCLVCVFVLCCRFAAAAAQMSAEQGAGTVVIRAGDEIVGTYRYGKDLAKPYLIAVSAPGALDLLIQDLATLPADEPAPGNKVFVAVEQAELQDAAGSAVGTKALGDVVAVDAAREGRLRIAGSEQWVRFRDVVPVKAMVTRIVNPAPAGVKDRAHPDYYDHPHHKGIWNAIDEVNGIKFWAEEGRIETASVQVEQSSGAAVRLLVVNHWLGQDGQPLLKEQTRISVNAQRLFTYDITFSAQAQPVTFEDTKEGMLAIRLPNSMREQFAQGPVVNADGKQGTKACWGQTSAWVDYVGPIGGRQFGVTVMDHPDNPRKSRYHVRDYGLFAINPFGQGSYTKGTPDEQPAVEFPLAPGAAVRFRYGIYVHRGDSAEGHVADAYKSFVESAR